MIFTQFEIEKLVTEGVQAILLCHPKALESWFKGNYRTRLVHGAADLLNRLATYMKAWLEAEETDNSTSIFHADVLEDGDVDNITKMVLERMYDGPDVREHEAEIKRLVIVEFQYRIKAELEAHLDRFAQYTKQRKDIINVITFKQNGQSRYWCFGMLQLYNKRFTAFT